MSRKTGTFLTNHSLVVDNFFEYPKYIKDIIDGEKMSDQLYMDGVTYPHIVAMPKTVFTEVDTNLKKLFGPSINYAVSFARYTFENTNPPHWAHSDRNIAEFLCLIYLNDNKVAERFGTHTLRHKATGLENHPRNDNEKALLLREANDKDAWEITYTCPAKYNRAFILNTDLIHAAHGGYGSNQMDGRLVATVFFDVV